MRSLPPPQNDNEDFTNKETEICLWHIALPLTPVQMSLQVSMNIEKNIFNDF